MAFSTFEEYGIHRICAEIIRNDRTGILIVGPHNRKAYFEGGRLLYAASDLPSEQMGPILVEADVLDEATLAEVKEQTGPGMSLGKLLKEGGHADSRQLAGALKQQIMRTMSGLLGQAEGEYRFVDDQPMPKVPKLKIHALPLFMRSVMQIERPGFPPSYPETAAVEPLDGLDVLRDELGSEHQLYPAVGVILENPGAEVDALRGVASLTVSDLNKLLYTLSCLELVRVVPPEEDQPLDDENPLDVAPAPVRDATDDFEEEVLAVNDEPVGADAEDDLLADMVDDEDGELDETVRAAEEDLSLGEGSDEEDDEYELSAEFDEELLADEPSAEEEMEEEEEAYSLGDLDEAPNAEPLDPFEVDDIDRAEESEEYDTDKHEPLPEPTVALESPWRDADEAPEECDSSDESDSFDESDSYDEKDLEPEEYSTNPNLKVDEMEGDEDEDEDGVMGNLDDAIDSFKEEDRDDFDSFDADDDFSRDDEDGMPALPDAVPEEAATVRDPNLAAQMTGKGASAGGDTAPMPAVEAGDGKQRLKGQGFIMPDDEDDHEEETASAAAAPEKTKKKKKKTSEKKGKDSKKPAISPALAAVFLLAAIGAFAYLNRDLLMGFIGGAPSSTATASQPTPPPAKPAGDQRSDAAGTDAEGTTPAATSPEPAASEAAPRQASAAKPEPKPKPEAGAGKPEPAPTTAAAEPEPSRQASPAKSEPEPQAATASTSSTASTSQPQASASSDYVDSLTPVKGDQSLAQMAAQSVQRLKEADARFSISFLVACKRETVLNLFERYSPTEIHMVERTVKGELCYILMWGEFDSYAAAQQAMTDLPDGLVGEGDSAWVVNLSSYLK